MPPITILAVVLPLSVIAGWVTVWIIWLLRCATLRFAPSLWSQPKNSCGLCSVPLWAAHP